MSQNISFTYEEIRGVALDILAKRELTTYEPDQYTNLLEGIGEVLHRRNSVQSTISQSYQIYGNSGMARLSSQESDIFMEVFWDLFRQGIITLGLNSSNSGFPWFRLSLFGSRILANQDVYFFHDVSTYEQLIRNEVPLIDNVTMIYLKEAMQAFRVGCLLSSTVMLGVAIEHTFNLLIGKILQNAIHATTYQNVNKEQGTLRCVNKFKNILDSNINTLTPALKKIWTLTS